MRGLKQRAVTVDDALWAQVTDAAQRDGVPVSEWVRRALVAALSRPAGVALADFPPMTPMVGLDLKRPVYVPAAPARPWSPPRGLSKAEQVARSPKGMRAGPAPRTVGASDE